MGGLIWKMRCFVRSQLLSVAQRSGRAGGCDHDDATTAQVLTIEIFKLGKQAYVPIAKAQTALEFAERYPPPKSALCSIITQADIDLQATNGLDEIPKGGRSQQLESTTVRE